MEIFLYGGNQVVLNDLENRLRPQNAKIIKSLSDIQLSNQIERVDLVIVDLTSLLNKQKNPLLSLMKEAQDGIIDIAKVFILSSSPNYKEAKYFMCLGAKGYGHLKMSKELLNEAVEEIVSKNNVWLLSECVQNLIEDYMDVFKDKMNVSNTFEALTHRERDIANLLITGNSYADISEILGITPRTIKAHVTSILKKYKVKDRIAFILKVKDKDF